MLSMSLQDKKREEDERSNNNLRHHTNPRQSTIQRLMQAHRLTPSSTNDTNGFFKLPRELRDQIYDLLYIKDSETRAGTLNPERQSYSLTEPQLAITTHSTVAQSFLLNRRFMSEYIERSSIPIIINRTMLRSNRNLLCHFLPDQSCPAFARGAADLEVRLEQGPLCVWCNGKYVLRPSTLDQIARFASQMPALKNVRVHLYFRCTSHGNWTCGKSFRYFRYWDESKTAVESLASGSPPCWPAVPVKMPTLEISWYCQMGAGLEDAVCFCKWTKEGGIQLDLNIAYNCKAKMNAAQMGQG